MSSPVDDRPQPTYAQPSLNMRNSLDTGSRERGFPTYNINSNARNHSRDKSSDGEGTMVGESETQYDLEDVKEKPERRDNPKLNLQTENGARNSLEELKSPSQAREQASRLDDDLEMLKIERQVSRMEDDKRSRSKSRDADMSRTKSRRHEEHVDEFDAATNPVHEKTQIYQPVENPSTNFSKFVTWVHGSGIIIRWFFYVSSETARTTLIQSVDVRDSRIC